MQNEWSDEVLEETPSRVTKLLSGIGALAEVRTQLGNAGMSDADIDEGRKLLMASLATPGDGAARAENDTESARAQRDAVAELDAWDEPNFARYKAALARRVPSVGLVLFVGLEPAQGVASVMGVATLLARLDGCELHAGAERGKGTANAKAAAVAFVDVSKGDCKAALDLLAKRGLDRGERDRLGALVATALGPTEVLAETHASAKAPQDAREARREAQRALRAWYEEWSATARAVVKKRVSLIRLGLAKRKAPGTKKPSVAKTTPAPSPAVRVA